MTPYDPHGADVNPRELTERIGILKWLEIRFVEQGADDRVVAEMPVTDQMKNLLGIPHGGSVATLIDYTAGMACALLTPFRVSTADMHVRYLAPARGSVVRAEGTILRAGKRLVIVEVRVSDDEGTFVATATAAMAPINPG